MTMVELACLIDGELDHLLRAWRERDLTWRARHVRGVTRSDDEFDRRAHLGQLDAERVQDVGRDALALAHEAKQKMLGPDVVVFETDRLFLRVREDLLGAVVEAFERAAGAAEGARGLRRRRRRRVLRRCAEKRDHLGTKALQRHACRCEDTATLVATVAHEAEQQVLGADVPMAELAGLFDGVLDDPLRVWRQRYFPGWDWRVTAPEDLLDS